MMLATIVYLCVASPISTSCQAVRRAQKTLEVSKLGAVDALVPARRLRKSKEPPLPRGEWYSGTVDEEVFVRAGFNRNCVPRDTPLFPDLSDWVQGPQVANAGENASRWAALPQPQLPSQGRPKLAVLMFVQAAVVHENMWRKWVDQAKADGEDVALHIHVQSQEFPFESGSMRGFVAEESKPTQWCDIYAAEQYLLGKALEDRSVTHVAIVSADSVPILPLKIIHEELLSDSSSRMCMDIDWEEGPRAETWWSMRREDAQLFHENDELVASLRQWGCTEENRWLEPLLLRQKAQTGPPVRNQCVMMTDWLGSCKGWARNNEGVTLGHLRQEPHREASEGHPRLYCHVSKESWAELQRSGYWFGRKFAPGAFDDLKGACQGIPFSDD